MVVFPYIGSENLGITYLSSVLKTRGIKTKLAFEPSLFDDTKFLHIPSIPRLFRYNERFANYIVSLKPKILAFSVFTMNCLWALDIAERVKRKIDVITVFGGVHVQAVTAEVLMYPQVDYIILGEGEYALCELAESILNGKVDLSTKNLGYRKGSEIVLNPIRPFIENLDELPFPDRDMFAEVEDFRESMLFLCGRGCPFKCTFCSNSMMRNQYPNKNKFVRFHSVDRCLEEMKLLIEKYNPKHFQIQDDVFTINTRWMKDFCLSYQAEIGLPFQVAGYPSTLNEEKFSILKQAGCDSIQVGIQSLNKDNRKNILKRYEKDEDISNCIKWARQYDIGISVDYIFFPWENNEHDQLKAAHFFHEHRPTRIANFFLSYLPGTEIIDYAEKNGYIKKELKADIKNGKSAYYHSGGEFMTNKQNLRFFNGFYNLFILLIILPKPLGSFLLFNKKAYRYTYFIPKIMLLIIKEYLIPFFSKKTRKAPTLVKYAKYYIKNLRTFVTGRYE